MFRFPLKQTFLDYFGLNGLDNTATSAMIHEFIYKELKKCDNPFEKSLEIWDTFVETNTDFFDLPKEWATRDKLKERRERIQNAQSVEEVCVIFGCVGASPFCDRP